MLDNSPKTLTIKELRVVINDIEELLSSIYTTDSNIQDKINLNLTVTDKEIIQKFLGPQGLPMDPDGIANKLNHVLHELKNLPRVRITMAFEPSLSFVNELKNKIDDMGNGGMTILEIVIEPTLIAGIKLEYNGLYRDYSIGNKVQEMLMTMQL